MWLAQDRSAQLRVAPQRGKAEVHEPAWRLAELDRSERRKALRDEAEPECCEDRDEQKRCQQRTQDDASRSAHERSEGRGCDWRVKAAGSILRGTTRASPGIGRGDQKSETMPSFSQSP